MSNKRKTNPFLDLSPIEFEHEIARLYERLGYKTQVTRGTGDGGVDIVMVNEKENVLVQCKRHEKPVGPAVIRELYGTLKASNANRAILVCTGGFTKGAKEFAQDNHIELLDADGILDLAASSRRSIDAMVQDFFKPNRSPVGANAKKRKSPSIDTMVAQFFKPDRRSTD